MAVLLIGQRERVVIDVVKTAQAAHISLTPEEVVKFDRQLGLVLDYVKCLRQVAVDGVEPLPCPVAQMGHLRADKVESGLSESAVLAAVPATVGGEVCVPRVIEA